jgi:hypothetical protein
MRAILPHSRCTEAASSHRPKSSRFVVYQDASSYRKHHTLGTTTTPSSSPSHPPIQVGEHRSEADSCPELAAKAADLDLGNVDKPARGGNVVLEVVGDIVEEEEGHVYVVIVN